MLKPGTNFAAYTIVRELGRGGMGEVYEAEHTGLGKRVALKVMSRLDDEHDNARQRFLMEGRAAARVRHENVVDVTDVGVHDGAPFLVMELLSGEALALLLAREAPLDARRIADLLVPVAGALAAAHDAGVLHRDVKPENIFLSRTRRGAVVPKVVDFGVSRVDAITDSEAQRLTHSANLIGTPRYLAPESVLGARNTVAASDQYALGVVLYECATGANPFREDTLFSLLWAILEAKFPRPSEARPGVDPALEAVILRAMQREPADRFPDMRALAEALLPLASEDTRTHWREEPAPRPLLGSSSFETSDDPAAHAAVTRDVPAVITRAALRTPPPESLPVLPSPAKPPRSLRLAGLAGAVALLCLATFFAGRAAPRTHAPPPPAPTAPAPLAVLAVAPETPGPAPDAVRAVAPPLAAPVVTRATPRAARNVQRPAPAAPAPAAPPNTPWSLRTRF